MNFSEVRKREGILIVHSWMDRCAFKKKLRNNKNTKGFFYLNKWHFVSFFSSGKK
jgi:hypothetical protein